MNFKALKGDLAGYYSVRVDKQYRLILSITDGKDIKISGSYTYDDQKQINALKITLQDIGHCAPRRMARLS